jgi:tRNA (guanine37-N1)-methyltransferase
MQIEILTIFPEYFRSPLAESLLGKGIASGLLEVTVTDLRQFSADKHHKVDDEAFGGGPGMVMTVPVVTAAVEARRGSPPAWSVLLTPDGRRLDQAMFAEPRDAAACFSSRPVRRDRRALPGLRLFDQEVSLGDFVLAGGGRRAGSGRGPVTPRPGVVARTNRSSAILHAPAPGLPAPRAPRLPGLTVPDVLLSGDHAGSSAGGGPRAGGDEEAQAGPAGDAPAEPGKPER